MEENKTVFFRGEFTYTRKNLRKFQWASVFLDKYLILFHTFFLALSLLITIYLDDSDVNFYTTVALATFLIVRLITVYSNTTYNRLATRNEGTPLQVGYEFNNYHIINVETCSGNQYKYHYDQVSRIGRTKDLYIIFLQHRQCLLVAKDTVTNEAGNDFVHFMCAACPNMKPKKVLSGLFGKIVFVALIAMLCFVLMKSMAIYFL